MLPRALVSCALSLGHWRDFMREYDWQMRTAEGFGLPITWLASANQNVNHKYASARKAGKVAAMVASETKA